MAEELGNALSILLLSTVKLQDSFTCVSSTEAYWSYYFSEFGQLSIILIFQILYFHPLFFWKMWLKFTHQTEMMRNKKVCETDWYPETGKKTTHPNSINFGCKWSLEGFIQVLSNPKWTLLCWLTLSICLVFCLTSGISKFKFKKVGNGVWIVIRSFLLSLNKWLIFMFSGGSGSVLSSNFGL